MQREIYRHGPLVAGFDVYDDFLSYQTGKSIQSIIVIIQRKTMANIGYLLHHVQTT